MISAVITIPTFVLTFWVQGVPYEGGQYISEERCRAGAKHQIDIWRMLRHTHDITWRCELKMPGVP
jgi:hypothetical protein